MLIIELKEHINDLERYIKFTETNYEEQISNLASHNLQLINENHQLKAKNIEQKSEIKYLKQALNNLYGRDIYE